MIEGIVNADLEAVVTVPVSGPAGQVRDIQAVIDTGFNGLMTLPPGLIGELRLPRLGSSQVTLANGSEATFDVFGATLLWNGQSRSVAVDSADITPLVGMALLESHDLHIKIREGGRVLIQADSTR